MANNITPSGGRSLSADMASRLRSGIAESRATTILPGGKPILRLLKSGSWVFGQNDDDVQIGSEWAINPMQIGHGWCCWSNNPGNAKNTLLGEQMVNVLDHKPMLPDPVPGGEWKEQRVCDLMCLNGDDEGTEVVYKTNSLGGLRAFDGLLAAITAQIDNNPDYLVAIVQLKVDSYDHQKYGQTFIPILDVVGWADMEGNRAPKAGKRAAVAAPAATPPAAAAAPAKPAKPVVPAKAKKAPLTVAAAAPVATPAEAEDDIPFDVETEETVVETVAAVPLRPGAPPRRQRPQPRA